MKPIFTFLVFSLLIVSLYGQKEYFVINDYNVNIQVQENGDFVVNEQIFLEFDTLRRGIIRSIPVRYNIDGKKRKIKIQDVYVKDWEYKTYEESGDKKIRIGSPDIYIDGLQIYDLNYTVSNAYLWNENRPEFYWDIIAAGWNVPIDRVNYKITFLKHLDIGFNDYQIFTGLEGSREENAEIKFEDSVFMGRNIKAFKPNEAMTIAIRLPEGFIEKPTPVKDFFNKNREAPIPILAAILLIGFWRREGRNKLYEDEIVQREYPPENFSSAEAGLFIDNRVNSRDIVSLVPYWANLGLIKIWGSAKDPDTQIERIKNLPEKSPEYQQIVFDKLFESSDLVSMKDIKNKLYSTVAKSGSILQKDLRSRSYFDEEAKKRFHTGWMLALFPLMILAGSLIIFYFGQILTGALFIFASLIPLVIHFLAPKKSDSGLKLQRQLLGFKSFLKNPDQNKLNYLLEKDPNYFEAVYPYAMAFGIDKDLTNWVRKYRNHGPSWYYYRDHHNAQTKPSMDNFHSGFKAKTITSAFVSQPVSSSGGGGGGGGFSGGSSGGGFGGGGGSSW